MNTADAELNTPLHVADMAGQADYIIQHGANVMAVNAEDCTPYDYIDGIPQAISLSQNIHNKT